MNGAIVAARSVVVSDVPAYPFVGDKLVIGKFCALARGVRFIMNGANHQLSGFSTYPFYIFEKGWELVTPHPRDFPYKGDTVLENDVWLRCSNRFGQSKT